MRPLTYFVLTHYIGSKNGVNPKEPLACGTSFLLQQQLLTGLEEESSVLREQGADVTIRGFVRIKFATFILFQHERIIINVPKNDLQR